MTRFRPDTPQEIHDYWKGYYPGIKTVSENLEQIPRRGYEVIAHFTPPEDASWIDHYGPTEKRIKELSEKYVDHPKALLILDKEQREIDIANNYRKSFGSTFFVTQKTFHSMPTGRQKLELFEWVTIVHFVWK